MSDLGTGNWKGPFPGQQTKFWQASEDVVFGGGAGGGGKSILLKMAFIHQLVFEHERYRAGKIKKSKAWAIYFRRKTPDLTQAIDESHEYFPQIDPKAKFDAKDGHNIWTFPSCGGAKFQFAHMQHETDRFKYKSSAYTYLAFDELTEFEEIQFLYMQSRLRCADEALVPYLQCRAGSNPDGPGLLWVRNRFIEGREPERVYRTRYHLDTGETKTKDEVFIPFRLKDNPVLYKSGAYEMQLRGLPPEIREAILEGNWYFASGAFLARVWNSKVHVIDDHPVPDGVRIYRSADYGYNKPSSVTWWYLDRDGILTAFYNLYVTNKTPEQLADLIKEVEQEFGLWDGDEDGQYGFSTISGPLDSACWNKQSSAVTIAARLRSCGVPFYKARKGPGSRKNGAIEIISRLEARLPDPDAPKDRSKDRPLLRYMKRCVAPIRTLPILRSDPNDPDDVDTKGEDHCYDDLMYMCLANPTKVEKDHDPDEDEVDNVVDMPKRNRMW